MLFMGIIGAKLIRRQNSIVRQCTRLRVGVISRASVAFSSHNLPDHPTLPLIPSSLLVCNNHTFIRHVVDALQDRRKDTSGGHRSPVRCDAFEWTVAKRKHRFSLLWEYARWLVSGGVKFVGRWSQYRASLDGCNVCDFISNGLHKELSPDGCME